MKKSILLCAVALLSMSASSFGASLHALSKTQVIKELQENTVTTIPLATLNHELVNNTFTGYFAKDGKIQGQFASKPENAPQSDQGTWTVKADGTTCATWQHWNDSKPVCVNIYKLANALLLVNQQDKKFESLILLDNIKSGNQMTSN